MKSVKFYLIGGVIGVIGGFLYWKFVGCSSGSCAITSSPINSSIYGALMGTLLGGSAWDFLGKTKKTERED